MNGYFRLNIQQTGTMLELIPPSTADGVMPPIGEITAYLQSKRITQFDLKGINDALTTILNQPALVPLLPNAVFPEHEMMNLTLSPDKMTVTARFYAPSTGGSQMGKDEILKDLAAQRIKMGIDESAIDAFLAERTYCTDIVIARGKPARHGEDARIEYFFNTDLNARPERKEDGSVDFFNLNTINHCKEGDLLAKLFPEDPGEEGYNVFGEVEKPRKVKHLTLKYGAKIDINGDKTELNSQINGHVMLTGGKVFVSDVYQVENVGTATGNINSEGSVLVNGNVQTGFSVTATGNIEVKGVVEGATLIAGGDIIIARGMNGMNRGKLEAGGSVVSKFIENAEVTAGTYIEADSIMHSKVSAKNEIRVDGKKGFIAGGMVRATTQVSCRVLGSAMGADTVVEVGVDPAMKARFQELQKEMLEMHKKRNMINTTLTGAVAKIKSGAKLPPEQMQYVQSLMQAAKQLEEKLEEDDMELCDLEELLSEKTESCVKVRDTAYPGTKIVIGDESVTLKKEVSYCRFHYDKGDIRSATY
ncbi:MAG: FapA family protein [Lachnospiraceae bacterium]|nr:FapA family protein [Lachnospiraceae bacterium]